VLGLRREEPKGATSSFGEGLDDLSIVSFHGSSCKIASGELHFTSAWQDAAQTDERHSHWIFFEQAFCSNASSKL
jgi:hypothetical protein